MLQAEQDRYQHAKGAAEQERGAWVAQKGDYSMILEELTDERDQYKSQVSELTETVETHITTTGELQAAVKHHRTHHERLADEVREHLDTKAELHEELVEAKRTVQMMQVSVQETCAARVPHIAAYTRV